jgi:hypothetical protein
MKKYKAIFSLLLIISLPVIFPAIAQNEIQTEKTQEFEGKQYTNTQLRNKAHELIMSKNYEKALKVYDLVYFRIDDDFVKIAYCLLMLGKLEQAKNSFMDIERATQNPEIKDYARQMLNYINSELRKAALIKSYNESNKNCLSKGCIWKIYYRDGKIINKKSPPPNNPKEIWRVEALWKSGNEINSERWVWMDKAWISQETAYYDFQQEFIAKHLKEHREVQAILFKMYKTMDINCHIELQKKLIQVNNKEKDINIEHRILSLVSIINELKKGLKQGGYYNWETPMEIRTVSQARKEVIELNKKLALGTSRTSCFLSNTEYLNGNNIFNTESKIISSAIKQLQLVVKKYN